MKLLAALAFLVPLLLYSPILRNDYVAYDDELLIVDNVKARGVTWANVKQAFTTYDPELYIPLTLLTEQIEYSIVGEWNPAVSHGISLILHMLNAVLVFWLVMLLLRRSQISDPRFQKNPNSRFFILNSLWVPFAITLLWAVHPLNVEAVAWASARKDLLSGFFFLLSLTLYLKSSNQQQANEQRNMGTLYILSLITFLLGLLSKVSILTLPLILLLLDTFNIPNAKCQTKSHFPFLRLLPFFLLSLIFGIIAVVGKESQMRAIGATLLAPFLAVPFLLKKIIIPTGFSILYPFTEDLTLGHPSVLLGMVSVAAITAGAWWLRWWSRLLLLSWMAFLILLAPSFLSTVKTSDSGLIDIVVASDRFAYLASIIPIILVSYGLWVMSYSSRRRRIVGLLGFVGCLGFFGFLSLRQLRVWRSSEALFRNVLAQHQASHVAANNLAGFLAQRGETTEAMELYRQSLAISENPRALFNLGRLMTKEKRYGEARPLFERYVALKPRDAFGRMQLGGLYLMEHRAAEARPHLELAVARDPHLTEAHYLLGVARERLGDRAGAQEEYRKTLRLNPDHSYAKAKITGSL